MNWIQINPRLLNSFPPDGRYLVGVSGGRDSVTLLHWLIKAGYKNLVVCHLNHRLRGRSSEVDARFVQKLVQSDNQGVVGQALRLPGPGTRDLESVRGRATIAGGRLDFELGATNVRALAKKKKVSIETAAREARYAFFAEVAKRRRCRTIFLAHHADDLVETFLINLSRGAGVGGLAAMHEVSKRRTDSVGDLTIVRPLLGTWRKEINAYVGEHRLKFREDASNKNLAPLRNRIRQRVIPYLEKELGRNIRHNIWRTAMIITEEENWLDSQVSDSTNAELPVAHLRALPIALQRRAILKWLRAQNVANIGFDAIERVRSLLDPATRVAKVNLPRDRYVRRRAGRIFIE